MVGRGTIAQVKGNYDDVVRVSKTRSDTVFLAGGVPYRTPDFSNIMLDISSLNGSMAYSDTMGNPDLRYSYIKNVLSNNYKVEDILVTSGATSAIFGAMKSILKRDDEVIVLAPCWSIYEDIIVNCEGKPIYLSARKEDDWIHNIEQIVELITSKTRVILFADPANPTGIVPSLSFKKELLSLAQRHNIIIIVDETYRGLEYETNNFVSIIELENSIENIVCIRSMSKYFCAPGIRIGFCLARQDRIIKIHNVLRSMYLAPSSIGQYYAKYILTQQDHIKWHIKECRPVLDRLIDLSTKTDKMEIVMPDAAFFTCIRLYDENKEIIDASKLFEKKGILCRSGESFRFFDEGYLRLCVSISEQTADEVINRLYSLLDVK